MPPSKSHRLFSWWTAAALAALLAMAAAAQAAAVQRVVIMPFTANAKEDISYLTKGIRDMLASRLAWQNKVSVVEPDLVKPVLQRVGPPYNDDKARQVGEELGADVVVFGTVTALGKSVSVDARVVKVDQKGPALTAFVQAAELDAVIPRINDFAQRINAEIFRRPDAVQARQEAQQERQEQVRTAVGGSDAEKIDPRVSPLNPLFMRQLFGVDSDRYWRSPRISGTINSVAVADIDLDGRNEILVATNTSLRVYRLAGKHFAQTYELKNGPKGQYLFVDAADINGDGKPEVYVTCVNFKSVESFVLEWEGVGFKYLAKDVNYYFRTQLNPWGPGQVLFGQEASVDEPFWGPVYQLHWKGGEIERKRAMDLPPQATAINFCLTDVGRGSPLIMLSGPSYHLRVYSSADKEIYRGSEYFNASAQYIPFNRTTGSGEENAWWYLHTRLVPVDLDKDGKWEVLGVQNSDRTGMVIDRMRAFYKGTIYSLGWNGMALTENWRTPRISGYVSDYTIADVGNIGQPALVLSVNQKAFQGLVDKGMGYVVAFTLKPQKKATPGLPEEQ